MRPARRIPVDDRDVLDKRASSGIRYKRSIDELGIIAVPIPPLDPLPRLWTDADEDGDEGSSTSERMVVVTPREVTAQHGLKISIAPSEASIRLLSSRPPRRDVEAARGGVRRLAMDAGVLLLAFVLASGVTLLVLRALSLY